MAEPGCPGPSVPAVPCPIPYDAILKSVQAKHPRGWTWDAVDIEGTVQHGLARGWAWIAKDVADRACELLPEFVCHTTDEMVPEWNSDYGLPDDCGINDLCAKVAALGGANCEYFTGLAEYLGYVDTCCNDVPPEIMAGCWNLGCQPMPPPPVWIKGGSALGAASLPCLVRDCGSGLGHDILGPDECNVAGYGICVDQAPEMRVCATLPGCMEYVAPVTLELLVGCYAPREMAEYLGTAYHWTFGVPGTHEHLLGKGGIPARCVPNDGLCEDFEIGVTPLSTWDPGEPGTPGIFPITGCWEMGCTNLCEPAYPELLCFINQLKPAHTVAIPVWCDT